MIKDDGNKNFTLEEIFDVLSNSSFTDLIAIQNRTNSLIETKRSEEKANIIQQMNALAESSGFTVAELLGGKLKGTKKRAASLETYRNPNDHSQTWAGRGRKPQWLNDVLASGKTLADIKV